MRTKIIVLGIIGVIVFIMLYFIYLTLPKKEQENGDEVKLRSEIKSGYTVDEMIKEVTAGHLVPADFQLFII